MKPVMLEAEIGVIVGRFQVPDLHPGHRSLIDAVRERHRKVLILVGCTPGVLVTRRNPLDYHTRMLMIREYYPDVSIMPIYDMPSDFDWSEAVDERVEEAFNGMGRAILYGSRNAFIPHYHGKWPTVELAPSQDISGSEVRQLASDDVRAHSEFRRGVVYAAYNRHPIAYSTVDLAVVDAAKERILLGRKKSDPPGRYRFPGGFVDPRRDNSLLETAKREAFEELGGIAIDTPHYIGSCLVNDWRYRNELDKIITNVFVATYLFGPVKAGDDLHEVRWFQLEGFESGTRLVEQHWNIYELVLAHLQGVE